MAATKKRVTKSRFAQINREVKAAKRSGTYDSVRIAKQFSVGRSTITTIARTGSWPRFQAYKASRREHARYRELDGQVSAKMNGVELGQQIVPSIPVPRQLKLEAPEREYVTIELTREEYRSLISLEQRVEALEQWRQDRLDVEKGLIDLHIADAANTIRPRRRGLFSRRRR